MMTGQMKWIGEVGMSFNVQETARKVERNERMNERDK
jgi:hypothetical protein